MPLASSSSNNDKSMTNNIITNMAQTSYRNNIINISNITNQYY